MTAYAGLIPPLVGESYWPKVTYQLQPPPIKIGPGRPRKKRVKDPYENPTKPGVLTKNGVEMTCSLCNVKGHNKRKCPEKGKVVPPEPAARPRGRPRSDGQQSNQHQTSGPQQPQQQTANPHHGVSAQPTQLGKGGRAIRRGRGSKGGHSIAGRG
ncbi:uncharacterized protein LOC110688993 [Chenopodium quinoa]|uniref:uncharacterized protein LOC110688993 n=1 Tax=Chenopodium quinoa TaxID=63459 RepID=UPI000B793457|nr:uncharacterized protein LOC110688993 [Chenopodium quinoa]